ncbi:hypothetical protein BIZ78_gp060 [Erwinia phage vB_EamM_Caitlin]|uniref:hypothetical protein n=1 Tax=Erwinia phage vB_EamM_Caitlin TaxID=1883379 RepID=UPI00081CAA4A|nr:hypothetical protein BIZ78_gp060 [Erwinia phage vB_EamM_Caitlin]ANZ48515.1 hypothetical protein CAITLIN_220 [Erwinia phage vB_EamM_Caitlin]
MLTIEVPELRRYNQDFFRQLFDKLWPGFQIGHLGEGFHDRHIIDVFFVDSVSLLMDTFSHSVDEVVQAANLRRPFDLDYVIFDHNDYMDTYSFEDPELPCDKREHFEGLMFEFFNYLVETLQEEEFMAAITADLTKVWNSIAPIVGTHGIVGFWYEAYLGANNMWMDGDKIYGIQESDYAVIYTGVWDGVSADTVFYQMSEDADQEFYLYHGCLVQASYANDILQRGEVVTLCRLTDNTIKLLDK